MKLPTKEQQKSYENAKIYYICKVKFENKHFKYQIYHKIRNHCHYSGEYRIRYSVPKGLPIAFHNGSIYDYRFIIKSVAEEFFKKIQWFRRKR